MRIALLCATMVLLSLAFVSALPQLPVGYYGDVTDDSSPVTAGTVVVKDDNEVELSQIAINDQGKYSLVIPWDDPETTAREGIVADAQLHFYVDDERVTTVIAGAQGADIELDLDISEYENLGAQSPGRGDGSSDTVPQPGDVQTTTAHGEQTSDGATGAVEDTEDATNEETQSESETTATETAPATSVEKSQERTDTENKQSSSARIFMILAASIAVVLILIGIRKRGRVFS